VDWHALFSDAEFRRNATEVVGFLAAGTTVTAFYCQRMFTLRIAAIGANVLFITYGFILDLKPVLALHCVLLPLNIIRLAGALRLRQSDDSRREVTR